MSRIGIKGQLHPLSLAFKFHSIVQLCLAKLRGGGFKQTPFYELMAGGLPYTKVQCKLAAMRHLCVVSAMLPTVYGIVSLQLTACSTAASPEPAQAGRHAGEDVCRLQRVGVVCLRLLMCLCRPKQNGSVIAMSSSVVQPFCVLRP